jgi:hypothetical protein
MCAAGTASAEGRSSLIPNGERANLETKPSL